MGHFFNDTRWGLGTAYYRDGSPKYSGPWVNGQPEGNNGTLYLTNGQKYTGVFERGRPQGIGVLYGPDGQVVEEGTFGLVDDQEQQQQPKDFLGLNLTDNKYANLIKSIVDYVSQSWPFS